MQDRVVSGPLKLKTKVKVVKPRKHKRQRKDDVKEVVGVEVVSGEKEPVLSRTAAEVEFERKKEERMMEIIWSRTKKFHKQRIVKFKEQLDLMNEHFGISKMSWTK
nr:hypothetical protein HmN_000280200 [Hymenolepis microstoma]